MVLGKLPASRRPSCTNLDTSRARAYCACCRCGWRFIVFSRDGPISKEISSERAVKPKTTNQPCFFALVFLCVIYVGFDSTSSDHLPFYTFLTKHVENKEAKCNK